MISIVVASIAYFVFGLIFLKFIIQNSILEVFFNIDDETDYGFIFLLFLLWPIYTIIFMPIFIGNSVGRILSLIVKRRA